MVDEQSRYRSIIQIASFPAKNIGTEETLQGMLASACECLRTGTLLLLGSRSDRTWIEAGEGHRDGIPSSLLTWITGFVDGHGYRRIGDTGEYATVLPVGFDGGVYDRLVYFGSQPDPGDLEYLLTVSRLISDFLNGRSSRKPDADLTQKRVQEISAIHDISEAVGRLSIAELLRLITEKAAEVMDAQTCSLMLKDNERDELVMKANHGISPEVAEEARVLYGEGIAGRVAQTGESMLVEDLRNDPRFEGTEVVPRPEIISSMSVPLRDAEGRVHGVISISRMSPAAVFNESDVKVFTVFGSQAALAVSNAYLYDALEEKVEQLSMLCDAGRRLSSAESIGEASDALVNLSIGVGGFDAAVLVLRDSNEIGGVQACCGLSANCCSAIAELLGKTSADWMRDLRGPQGLLNLVQEQGDTEELQEIVGYLAGEFAWTSLVPLTVEESVTGVLILANRSDVEGQEEALELISIMASQAATVIKNSRRYERQIDQRVLELSALFKLSESISGASTFEDALDSILNVVLEVAEFDECLICTVDDETGVVKVQASRGPRGGELLGVELAPDDDDLVNAAIHQRKARVFSDISKDRTIKPSPIRGMETRSLMSIPLVIQDRVVGILSVRSYSANMYSEEDVRVLSIIASQAAALYTGLQALNSLTSYTDNILMSLAAGVATLDRDGRVLIYNKAAEEIMQVSAEEAIGEHFSSVISKVRLPESEKSVMEESINSVILTGERFVGYKLPLHPIGRESQYVNVSVSQLRDNNGEALGLVTVFEDVTGQVQMESDIRRISDMAVIGELAANIAHEIRNPLSSIKGAAQYLCKEYSDHTSVKEFLDIIIEEVNVLNGITTEFLEFARPPRMNAAEVDANAVLARTAQFMQSEIKSHGVSAIVDLGDGLPSISGDAHQLELVFRNMFLNSIQAMPNGGTLNIQSRSVRGGIKIGITDDGIGMGADVIEQIFTPFFTTKTKGTGLGLAVVLKIVENHGGRISVESGVGKGTTFEIFLPVAREDAPGVVTSEVAWRVPEVDLFRRSQIAYKGK